MSIVESASRQADLSQAAQLAARFQDYLVALIPHLRVFSRSLCGDRTIAEDMAQEALAKAWRARDRFEPGTNLKAWVFTILRNEFYSHARRAWRETHWDADKAERIAAPANEQDWTIELSDTARAMRRLPNSQRESLILVAVGGFSYEDASRISKTPIGTIKSRVTRARAALVGILEDSRPLPPVPAASRMVAADDILAQLSALIPAGSGSGGPLVLKH